MTKAERLAVTVARKKALLEKQRQAVAQDEARLRDATRKATDKRRYAVGALAEEAGILTWRHGDLRAVFLALAPLRDVDNPAAVLSALLCEAGVTVGPENGVAEAGPRVSAAH